MGRKTPAESTSLSFDTITDVAFPNDKFDVSGTITAIDAQKLFDDGLLPQNLANTVVTHEDYANGNAYLTLSSKGRQLWDDNWTAFRNG